MSWRWPVWMLYYAALRQPVPALFNRLQRYQWLATEELNHICNQRLAQLLEHAVQYVPYYRQLECSPELNSFPVLNKDALQRNFDSLQAKDNVRRRTWLGTSSGSTGQPTRVLMDRRFYTWRTATGWRGDYFGGLKPTDSTVAVWSSTAETFFPIRLRRRLKAWLFNRYILGVHYLNEARVRQMHAYLKQLQPRLIYGFVSGLIGYSRFARELGLKPVSSIRKVMPTAEHCTPQEAEELTDYFKAPVRQRFGCVECGDLAHQCEHGVWHIHSEHAKLEVLADDGLVHSSGRGRLLVTSLSNYVMPLIRYDLADIVDLTQVPCKCGRSLPTFKAVHGRAAEFVYCPDGRWVSSLVFTHHLRHMPLQQFRVIQDAPDHVKLIYVPRPGYCAEHEVKLRTFIEPILGDSIRLDLEQVEVIEPLPGGKHVHILNLLDKPQVPKL